jgi:RNA polymerase sigma-70 factor (ECF subfamily)
LRKETVGVPGLTTAPRDANDVAESDDVVRRAQQGDVAAIETIYRKEAPKVLGLCRRMVRDDTEARELVQDIFVRAWEKLPTFRGQSALGTWLHRLAVNVIVERLRATNRDRNRLVATDDDGFGAAPQAASVEDRLDLDAALTCLPQGARSVFVLHDIEGYSHEEIAQMTGIAPGTARAQLWRARRALMRLLDR